MTSHPAPAVDPQEDEKDLYGVYAAALDAMSAGGPQGLARRLVFEAEPLGRPELAEPEALVSYLESGPPSEDRLWVKLKRTLASWDAEASSSWTAGTAARTTERRRRIYELLELDDASARALDGSYPAARDETIVISRRFEQWYDRAREEREPFYWKHYAEYLAAQGWDQDSISGLDLNTFRIVERLADPERKDVYQAKGLVVGHVQSGKTANFTGVAAKAIDAGYRLLIVLTGTTNLLRAQTQRRIDKELVGDENLMRGVDPDDEEAVLAVDYHGDPDRHEFVRHGGLPSKLGASDILRLTTNPGDYASLKQGIRSLDFEPPFPERPLNDPKNLHRLPTRIAIVKKNKSVLEKLVKDLRHITAKLEDIPALIIDDESDQASINTSDPGKWSAERPERTTINRLISELLKMLKRSQYVGYTATPFANVFVDADDAVDIFPRDFILSLDRPPGYMGPNDFHDLDQFPEGEVPTPSNSNEKAFVRPVREEEAGEKMVEAIDAFVLTGAVKLFREAAAPEKCRFKHHTMLVHESVKQEDHRQLAEEIRQAWREAAYYGARGHARLEALFDADLAPVMAARAEADPVPASYKEVKPHVAEVVARIQGHDADPVLIVNGDKEAAKEEVDFQSRPVWRILVGGTKLSRGFTVEGLTVSYYRRATKQADTLMQMGRWFGFRAHYRDLVRLYIDRAVTAGKSTFDLYEAFEAACRSEELFRAELSRYAEMKDGEPQVTPRKVPPLVEQHLGWLKPTASKKMYNAELVERRSPGVRLEPSGYPTDPGQIAENTRALLPLVESATQEGEFRQGGGSARGSFAAFYGEVAHADLVAMLQRLHWRPDDHFAADLTWLAGLDEEQIGDWIVMLPQHLAQGATSMLAGRSLSVFRRRRRRGTLFGAISDPKHRAAGARIAGTDEFDDPQAASLYRERRGSLLLYPVVEAAPVPAELGPEETVLALSFVAPRSTGSPDKALVRFKVRDSDREEEPIVDA
jgi:Z1 domain